MTAVGKRITVVRSTVTSITIGARESLDIEGVDQGSAGQTLQSHSRRYHQDDPAITYSPGTLVLPPAIAEAVRIIAAFAQKEIDKA